MLQWMRHPEHGVIDVYEPAMVEYNRKLGWEVCGEPGAHVENEIDALRAKAIDAGIEVDMRWGIKRLQQEIEAVS